MTIAHAAAAAPDVGVLRLLLARGISFKVRDQIGAFPIHVAALEGRLSNFQFLVEEAGMDPSVPDQMASSAWSDLWLTPWLLEFQPDLPVGRGLLRCTTHASISRSKSPSTFWTSPGSTRWPETRKKPMP